MININEHSTVAEERNHAGLLVERVEQDLSDALNEFGSRVVDHEPEQAAQAPRISFGYGIPMAGVRYYSFTSGG